MRASEVVQSLNGLRAVAVVLVMLVHAGAPGFGAGWLGVDIFFVLSGFLITSLLLSERDEFENVNLRLFWGRRFLRLMPIYIIYSIGITLAIHFCSPESLTEHYGWKPWMLVVSMWTYWLNYVPQGGIWTGQYLLRHLWSLSVEEQFYFVWPVALTLISRKYLLHCIWACAIIMILLNICGPYERVPNSMLYTRGVGLIVGCGIAIAIRDCRSQLERIRLLSYSGTLGSASVAVCGFFGISILVTVLKFDESDMLKMGIVPAFDLAVGMLIANLWVARESPIAKLLQIWPLPQLGVISYGMYLYHMLAWALIWNVMLNDVVSNWSSFPKYGVRCFSYFLLTIIISQVSYSFIEKRFLKFKGGLRRGAAIPLPISSRCEESNRQPECVADR